jgi:hypothetical protein
MNHLKIIGIQVLDRVKEAHLTQQALTRHANCIRTRLGFHELNEAICSRNGLILLELCGNDHEQAELEKDLKAIGGMNIQEMKFTVNKQELKNEKQDEPVTTAENFILGIMVKNRQQNILKVQDTFTKFGCTIRTRLGINVSRDYQIEDAGLILLELIGDVKEMLKLENELKKLEGIEVHKMVFA